MTNPLLLIRTDAGPSLGAGHAMRCLALAQAWGDVLGGSVLSVMAAPERVAERFRSEGFDVMPATGASGGSADAEATLSIARRVGATCLVTDGYHFDAAFQAALRVDGLPLLSIDDSAATGPSAASVILDQNEGVSRELYSDRPRDCRLLLGTRFALLRREFRRIGQAPRAGVPQLASLLVTLGGGDAAGVVSKVLDAISRLQRTLSTRVLVGPAGASESAVTIAARARGLDVECVRGGVDLPELMSWADLAVTGGGSTCWELAYLGVPALVIELAENQRPIAGALSRAGVVERLGWHEEVRVEAITAAIQRVASDPDRLREMSLAGQALVDGRGALRVAALLGDHTAVEAVG